MAKVRTPRGAWVHAALQALAAGGPDAVRVENLAASLGVSKGGFYWHFADRQALLEEMLDTWEKTGTQDIITRVASHPGDARGQLQKLFDITSSPEGLAVELAVRDWSRRDGNVAGRLRRADNRRMTFVRSLFGEFCADQDDVEVRSMMSYSMVIGSYFVAVEHGDKTRSQVLQLAIEHLLR
ncbi:MAG: TetR/AcrR family transcriptional regulator [Actinomycetota bacterium]|nr:TetR/AcrR family transcriptional regulator [Actinomycetota bacterium]